MCEANVYIVDESGEEKLFLEAVDKILPQEDNLLLENIFGQRKTVKARIKEMQLVEHRIVIQK